MPEIRLLKVTDSLEIVFKVDLLGIIFATLFLFVWILVAMASIEYMGHEKHRKGFYAFFAITGVIVLLEAFAGNFFTYYCLFEAMTLLSMPMVLNSRSHESVMAALKYLFYSMAGAFLTLFGFFLFMSKGYDLSFVPGGNIDEGLTFGTVELIGAFCMILGFATKAGMFPMHGWLPTAHPVAPAPASAVLSGVITKVGVLGVIRSIFYCIGVQKLVGTWVQYTFLVLSLITVFMGSMMAYQEKVLKKRLAYSTVSQVSYILFGIATMQPLGFIGAVLHVIFHSLVKDILFLSAGAIIIKARKKYVSQLDGIGRKMPITMWCFTISSITLIAIPPTSAFISKWYLAQGALGMDISVLRWLGPVILLISALLTAGYLLTVSIRAFLYGEKENLEQVNSDEHPVTDPGLLMVVPMMIMTVMSVLFGIWPSGLLNIISSVTAMLF